MCVCVCVQTHRNDVDKVIFSQGVQDGVDGVFGYGQPQALHAATDVHHNHHVFGRRGSLDVPTGETVFRLFRGSNVPRCEIFPVVLRGT